MLGVSGSPAEADASCAICSIIQTAKANRLDPYTCLHYLFDEIPTITSETDYAALLPENLTAEQTTNAVRANIR